MGPSTFYVDSSGVADAAPPYVRDAVKKLQARAAGTRYWAAVTQPAAPAAPVVNDTTLKPGILNRARSAIKNIARPAAVGDAAAVGEAAAQGGGIANNARAALSSAGASVSRARSALSAATTIPGSTAIGKGLGFVGRAAVRIAAPLAAPVAAGSAIFNSAQPDSTARYAKRFGVSEPSGDGSWQDMAKFAALRAGGFASDLGSAASGGLASNLFRDNEGALDEGFRSVRPGPGATSTVSAPATPGAGATTGPSQTDLSKLIDDQSYVPETGTGMFRNENTGKVTEVGGDTSTAAPAAITPGDGQPATRAKVTVPDASLLLNSGTVGKFLSQYSAAANSTIANNQADAAEKRSILQRTQKAEARKAETEAGSSERLDKVMAELISLNDNNDPGGRRRTLLRDLALTLGGRAQSNTTDTPRDRYLRSLTRSAAGGLQEPTTRTETQQWIDEQMRLYDSQSGAAAPADVDETPPMAGAQKAPDGHWYVRQGDKWARYEP